MHEDAYAFVRECHQYATLQPIPHATLYQVMVAPKWSHYLVDYLQTHALPVNISLARKRAIERLRQENMLL